MTTRLSSVAVRPFCGEFGELAAMMRQSWAENPNQSLLYTEDFLRSAFDYPGSGLDVAPALYGDAGLLGFVTAFPRHISWYGRPVSIALNSFLTVSASVKGSGFGLTLWKKLIECCRGKGYEGTINFCVEGDEMNRMMPVLARLCKLNTQRVYSVKFLSRLLLGSSKAALLSQASDSDIDLFMELASSLPDDLPLRRTWTRAEAEWQCRNRLGALVLSSRAGGRRGMLTGYLTQVFSTPPATVVLLEDLLWGDLELAERTDLLNGFLRAAAARGARVASCPVLGYSQVDILEAARFRRSNRVLHAYLTFWNGLTPSPVSSVYLDVI